MNSQNTPLADMNARSREVFRRVVEAYLQSGEPVGSRTLTRSMSEPLSAATIRNVMQDLEFLGLLGSPHVSAGRVPTDMGLRMFVDGLLEVDGIDEADRQQIDASVGGVQPDVTQILDRVSVTLSGITRGASLVLTPKHEAAIRHIDFVHLGAERALMVLVFSDGHVENRVFTPPVGLTPSAMREAANFLSAFANGRSLSELRLDIRAELEVRRREIDQLASSLVESGLAIWADAGESSERLIVRGRANLLPEAEGPDGIERVRTLFDDLERKKDIADFIDLAEEGAGVRIFIGSENKLFSLSGSSLVISPYMNAERKIIGAIGVIGPTRLNYGRIVPIVDYTAQLVSRMIVDRTKG